MHRWTQARLGSLTVTAALALVGTTAVAAAASPPGAYDRPGVNKRVSVASNGTQAVYPKFELTYGAAFASSDMSADGRYVAFTSDATNLVLGDTNGVYDVFVHDRKTGKTVRASVASDGSQALATPATTPFGRPIGSVRPALSNDGRYVAFVSDAINLVPGDTNRQSDVFVHDMKTRRTVRISVSSSGGQGNGRSGQIDEGPAISDTGRYVAFTSNASNLVGGDTNNAGDVFVRDLTTRRTVRVSLSSKGKQGNGNSRQPAISANGRYLAFNSRADNLVPGDTTELECQCPAGNVFWRDLKTGRTVRVSVASDGSQASFAAIPSCTVGLPPLVQLPDPLPQVGGAALPLCSTGISNLSPHGISRDGRYVTFKSNAANLVPNDSNMSFPTLGMDMFVHDVKTRRTERVSVDSYGRERTNTSSNLGTISANGRYVAYSAQTNAHCALASLVPVPVPDLPAGLNPCSPIPEYDTDSYLYDRLTGAMEKTSVSATGGTPRWGGCAGPDLPGTQEHVTWTGGVTGNGRYVTMWSSGTDLVRGDTNDKCDFFVRDRGTSLGVGGLGGGGSDLGPGTDEVCVADGVCLPPLSTVDSAGDVRAPRATHGADLIGSRVMPRPVLGDLFVRIDLADMSAVGDTVAGGLLYGLAFSAGSERYEVRVQRVPGADYDAKGGASFGLFRRDRATGLFTKVATLKGGYGTAGASVVVAVPAKLLGAGARFADVRAFTALGSYDVGVTRLLDAVRLSR